MQTGQGGLAGQAPRYREPARTAATSPLLALILLATSLVTGIAAVAGSTSSAGLLGRAGMVVRSTPATDGPARTSAPVLSTLAEARGPAGPQLQSLGRLADERLGWRRGSPQEAGARQGRGHPFAPLLAVLLLSFVTGWALSWRRDADRGPHAPDRSATHHPSRGPPLAA